MEYINPENIENEYKKNVFDPNSKRIYFIVLSISYFQFYITSSCGESNVIKLHKNWEREMMLWQCHLENQEK